MAMHLEATDVDGTGVVFGYEPVRGTVVKCDTEDEARALAQSHNCPVVVRERASSGWADLT